VRRDEESKLMLCERLLDVDIDSSLSAELSKVPG